MENAGQGSSQEIDIPAITEVLTVWRRSEGSGQPGKAGPLLIMKVGQQGTLIWCFNTWAKRFSAGLWTPISH